MSPPPNDDGSPLVISLGLRQGTATGNDIVQLHRVNPTGLNNLQIRASRWTRTLQISCSGLRNDGTRDGKKLDVAAALAAQLLVLEDEDTGEEVQIPQMNSNPATQAHIRVPPRTPYEVRIGLAIDSTDKVWSEVLHVGKIYVLRLSTQSDAVSYYLEGDSTFPDEDKAIVVQRKLDDQIRFEVFDDPPPPTFSAVLSLNPGDGTCSLSGSPPFIFVIEITSLASETVTVCTKHTPFGAFTPFGGLNCVDQLIHCVDAETNEEVDFPAQFACFDEDPWPGFPADNHFVEVLPQSTWRFEYLLDEASNSALGGLESLEHGREYRVQLSKGARDGFGSWMYGTKAALLEGTSEQKEQRWKPPPRGRGRVLVEQVNEPVSFEAANA